MLRILQSQCLWRQFFFFLFFVPPVLVSPMSGNSYEVLANIVWNPTLTRRFARSETLRKRLMCHTVVWHFQCARSCGPRSPMVFQGHLQVLSFHYFWFARMFATENICKDLARPCVLRWRRWLYSKEIRYIGHSRAVRAVAFVGTENERHRWTSTASFSFCACEL